MAIIEFLNGQKNKAGRINTYKTLGSMKRVIDYILDPNKTNDLISGGIYCNTNTAYEEFVLNKQHYNKVDKGRQCIHFLQSFDKKDNITPELAKKIADELLESKQFEGFQVVYAVHTDKAHIHTHFIVNTVNYETGIKWHKSAKDLQDIKDFSDKLCLKYNLSIVKESEKKNEHQKTGEYRSEQKYESWKKETFLAAKECKKVAKNKDEFIKLMNNLGYQVRWEDTRKDITFTNQDGKKINSDKLGQPKKGFTPFTKEALEKQFALNRQVKENQYTSVIDKKAEIINDIIQIGRRMDKGDNKYPFQNIQKGKLEGQALKEKLNQLDIGKGLDWGE